MRTDAQRLDWILSALDSGNGEPLDRLNAAYTLALRGRTAVDAAIGAHVVIPGEEMPAVTALDMVVAELGRIRNVKGFSETDDDVLTEGELACGAANYLLKENDRPEPPAHLWPDTLDHFKPSPDDRKRELTKGIALAVCELERVMRAESRDDGQATEAEYRAAIETSFAGKHDD